MDSGRPGPVSGAGRVASALILVASRHQYLNVTHSQKPPEVIDGPKDAWMSFGGVPRRLAIDNLKPATVRQPSSPSSRTRKGRDRGTKFG